MTISCGVVHISQALWNRFVETFGISGLLCYDGGGSCESSLLRQGTYFVAHMFLLSYGVFGLRGMVECLEWWRGLGKRFGMWLDSTLSFR